MNRQLFLIFKRIRSQDCITAEEIAVRENLSSNTVRLRVRELAEEMEFQKMVKIPVDTGSRILFFGMWRAGTMSSTPTGAVPAFSW